MSCYQRSRIRWGLENHGAQLCSTSDPIGAKLHAGELIFPNDGHPCPRITRPRAAVSGGRIIYCQPINMPPRSPPFHPPPSSSRGRDRSNRFSYRCNYRGEIARRAIMSDSCFSHASLNHGRGEEWPGGGARRRRSNGGIKRKRSFDSIARI